MFQQVNLGSAGIERPLDILAIAAHPDDVEQTCGGTLIRMAEMGYRTGVLDLTAGDMRSEEHTSELQSLRHLVCRLLLEKKEEARIQNSIINLAPGAMLRMVRQAAA